MKTREKILKASLDLCRYEGFQSVTMRRVAAEVGVSAPALYRHFHGKEDLLTGLIEEARTNFGEHLQTALVGRTPLTRFRRAAQAYLDFALAEPAYYELIFLTPNQEGLLGAPSSVESWHEDPPPTFRFCIDRVQECMDSGDFRPGDANEQALAFFAMAHGLVILFCAGRFGPDEAPFRKLFHRSIDRLIEGAQNP